MTTISAIIVDDEALGRVNLEYALREFPRWQIMASCDSAASARQALQDHDVDVIFVDIQMPNETGMELARSLCAQNEPPLIVFVTAYNNFAVEAFEIHALDYLLKPFDDTRLAATIERVESLIQQRQRSAYAGALRAYMDDQNEPQNTSYLKQISVRSIGKIETVNMDEVLWAQAAGNYIELHLDSRLILHRQPMGQFEARLDPAQFLRTHRSCIVRIEQMAVLKLVGDGLYRLQLRCGDEVAVSERYIDAVRAHMQTR